MLPEPTIPTRMASLTGCSRVLDHGDALANVVERSPASGHTVLFDGGEAAVADTLEGVEHLADVDESVTDRAEDAGLDRLPERQAPRVDLGQHVRTDVLEVRMRQTPGMALDHHRRIHAGVGEVPRVEAQVEICLGDQSLDLVLELDVPADVWVHHRVDPVYASHLCQCVELVHHCRPRAVVESRGGLGATCCSHPHGVGL